MDRNESEADIEELIIYNPFLKLQSASYHLNSER